MDFETTIDIDADPERVWATLVDVERWPQWTASMRELTYLDGDGLAPGRRVRIRQPRLPALVWEVSELDPGRCFSWRAESPGVTSEGVHLVRSTAAGTSVTLGIRHSGPLAGIVGRLTGGRTRRYVRMEAEGLKRRCEGP